ncbi:MAG: TonB family protein, partial [Fluviicola sp.]
MKPFSIETPCHEDWTKMQIARDGRHCLNCQKNVVDFTQMERHEILEYLFLHKNESVCGRIYKDQIDIDYTNLYVTIEGIAKQSKNKSLPFYLLTTLSLYLASCEEEKPKEKVQYAYQPTEPKTFNLDTIFVKKDIIKKDKKIDETLFYGGNFSIPSPSAYEFKGDSTVTKSHEIAIYKYGFDQLTSFIKGNINYPQSEIKKGKKGVVYIQFEILENGKVENFKILKNTTNSELLGQEAINVIELTK